MMVAVRAVTVVCEATDVNGRQASHGISVVRRWEQGQIVCRRETQRHNNLTHETLRERNDIGYAGEGPPRKAAINQSLGPTRLIASNTRKAPATTPRPALPVGSLLSILRGEFVAVQAMLRRRMPRHAEVVAQFPFCVRRQDA